MLNEYKKAPWWVWVILGLVALFIVLAVIGSFTASDDDDKTAAADTLDPAVEPTDTPAQIGPTTTPVPPTIPPPPPTPTPAPQPISLSGVGQFVTAPFSPPSGLSRISLTHNGGSNFIVWGYGPIGEQSLLVNTIGPYSGSRPLLGDGEWFLEVDADGPWTAVVEALTSDPAAASGLGGSGDYVSGFFQPQDDGPTPFEISHNGSSNFIVWLHCAGGSELVQNDIGPVSGSTVVRFEDGPCLWEIQSEGTWTVSAR